MIYEHTLSIYKTPILPNTMILGYLKSKYIVNKSEMSEIDV